MTIWYALPQHVDDVLALTLELHAETPHAPLNRAKLREAVADCLATGVVLVSVTADGALAGVMGFARTAPYFSDEEALRNLFFYVRPAYRREPHARDLVEAAAKLPGATGLPIEIGVAGFGKRTAGKIKLISRVLGEATGALWFKRT